MPRYDPISAARPPVSQGPLDRPQRARGTALEGGQHTHCHGHYGTPGSAPEKVRGVTFCQVASVDDLCVRLLYRGYKVGLVDQMETRALKKVGETRNETFKREVTRIYTVATYVDELGSVDQDHPPTLMCVVEENGRSSGGTTRIGITIVCPTTGEVTFDEFQGAWI